MHEKKLVGEKAVEFIKDGMVIGLGTGTTVHHTIVKLGQLVKEGMEIKGIPTSLQTEELATELGIPLIDYNEVTHIDVAVDGADEVDANLALIKGGGGALLREKIIAKAADTFIVVATPDKMVSKLGAFGLPVEVVPFGIEFTKHEIEKMGLKPVFRKLGDQPFKTDNSNYIFDCKVPETVDLKEIETDLIQIPGVVEHGLFVDMATMVITLDEEKNVVSIEK